MIHNPPGRLYYFVCTVLLSAICAIVINYINDKAHQKSMDVECRAHEATAARDSYAKEQERYQRKVDSITEAIESAAHSSKSGDAMSGVMSMINAHPRYVGVWLISRGIYAIIYKTEHKYYMQPFMPETQTRYKASRLVRHDDMFTNLSNGDMYIISQKGYLEVYPTDGPKQEWWIVLEGNT